MLAIWLLTLNLQGNGSVASAEPLSCGFSIILDKDDGSRHRRSARNKDVDSNSKTKLASYPRPTGRRRGTTAAFKRKTIDRLNPGLPKPVLQPMDDVVVDERLYLLGIPKICFVQLIESN
ncbi:hypothetical protein HZH68_001376 [Vespula germanica]|uniref:Uncharacterized protein n=1 Tax=Vespula germanica TaxID=30212 RepID=A0A834NVG6_VESGE|nr:hypothetical protein HZH68_001376 [Vespula germanica]